MSGMFKDEKDNRKYSNIQLATSQFMFTYPVNASSVSIPIPYSSSSVSPYEYVATARERFVRTAKEARKQGKVGSVTPEDLSREVEF